MPLLARIGCSVFFAGVVMMIGGMVTSYEDFELSRHGIKTKGIIDGFATDDARLTHRRIIYEYRDQDNNVRQKAVGVEANYEIPQDRSIEIVYMADHPERAKPSQLVTYRSGAIMFVAGSSACGLVILLAFFKPK